MGKPKRTDFAQPDDSLDISIRQHAMPELQQIYKSITGAMLVSVEIFAVRSFVKQLSGAQANRSGELQLQRCGKARGRRIALRRAARLTRSPTPPSLLPFR